MRVRTITSKNHFRNNSYVLDKDGMALVVDPSTNAKPINAMLAADNLRLIGILITHSHGDHVGQARYLIADHKVRMFMHVAERPLLHDAELEEEANELFHFKDYFIRRLLNRVLRVQYKDFTFFNESFVLGPFDIGVIHTPGHTPGSCFYAIDGYLFTGDALFVNSPLFYHVPGSSRKVGHRTSRRLLAMTELDDLLVMPGHGPYGVKMGEVKKTNSYFLHEANPDVKIHREWYRNRWFRRQRWHK